MSIFIPNDQPETCLLAQKSGTIILSYLLELTPKGYVVAPYDEPHRRIHVNESDPTMKVFKRGDVENTNEIIDWIESPIYYEELH